jgi:hypothetical protein
MHAGIMFNDITPLLLRPAVFKDAVDMFVERYRGMGIAAVAGKPNKRPNRGNHPPKPNHHWFIMGRDDNPPLVACSRDGWPAGQPPAHPPACPYADVAAGRSLLASIPGAGGAPRTVLGAARRWSEIP